MVGITRCAVLAFFLAAGAIGPVLGQAARVPEVIATLTPGATENITQTSDGSIYVTALFDRVLYKISPNGTLQKIENFADVGNIVGVVPYGDGVAVGVFRKCYIPGYRVEGQTGCVVKPVDFNASWALSSLRALTPGSFTDVESGVYIVDKSGKVTAKIMGAPDAFFNGMAALGNGKIFTADPNGTIWEIDPSKSTIEPWLQDDRLKGINGLEVSSGWVYVINPPNKEFLRIKIDAKGRPEGGLIPIAKGDGDDFAVTKDGTIYAQSGPTMYRISPKGEVTPFVENLPNSAASTISNDGKWLYWPTRITPRGGGPEPNKVLRVPIP